MIDIPEIPVEKSEFGAGPQQFRFPSAIPQALAALIFASPTKLERQ
jgi:hypothetical protein